MSRGDFSMPVEPNIEISKAVDLKDAPLVSYCLFTYNQECFVKATVEAVLSQTYSPLEIIISDDCSSDQTFKIIEEVVLAYEGPHQVITNRNEINLGIGAHVSSIVERTQGEFIIMVGGDDISSPEHVKVAVDAIQASGGAYMVDFDASAIDEDGDVIQGRRAIRESFTYNLEDFITDRRKISTFAPGRIIHRDVVDKFPPIASSCPTEDTVFVLRALMLGELRREPIDLIQYRRTGSSVSSSANIAKLSVDGIINQYYTDLEHALANGILSEVDGQRLRRRVAFESFKRQIKMQNNKGFIRANLARWKVKFYAKLYRRGIPLGPFKDPA
jgi:glycosyltransferase involved in cell wall biosynthesis